MRKCISSAAMINSESIYGLIYSCLMIIQFLLLHFIYQSLESRSHVSCVPIRAGNMVLSMAVVVISVAINISAESSRHFLFSTLQFYQSFYEQRKQNRPSDDFKHHLQRALKLGFKKLENIELFAFQKLNNYLGAETFFTFSFIEKRQRKCSPDIMSVTCPYNS